MSDKSQSHVKLLAIVFASLLALTVITVAVSRIHFGSVAVNILIAMGIATIKGSLVLVYFMHLKWEDRLTKIFAFLAFPIMILFVLVDLADLAVRIAQNIFLN